MKENELKARLARYRQINLSAIREQAAFLLRLCGERADASD